MSSTEIHKRIVIAETALKDAGPNQALNAVFDVLKEIARTLEALEKSANKGPSLSPPAIPNIPPTGGKKIRS